MALLIGGTLAFLFLPSPWRFVAIALLAAFEVLEIFFWLWLRGKPARSGTEGMVGETGVVSAPGRVRIRGTTYPAKLRGAAVGDRVVVESVDGMLLAVRPAGSVQEEAS